MSFQGYTELDGTFMTVWICRLASGEPVDADQFPQYAAYGPGNLPVAGASGTLARLDPRAISGATAASPIVIASAGHGLTSGQKVSVWGVGGVAGANVQAQVTVVDADHFSLNGTTGTGAYTSGGQWARAGVYGLAMATPGSSGFDHGLAYHVLVSAAVAGLPQSETLSFLVS